jgi:hypothetical protein
LSEAACNPVVILVTVSAGVVRLPFDATDVVPVEPNAAVLLENAVDDAFAKVDWLETVIPPLNVNELEVADSGNG